MKPLYLVIYKNKIKEGCSNVFADNYGRWTHYYTDDPVSLSQVLGNGDLEVRAYSFPGFLPVESVDIKVTHTTE